MLAGVRGSVHFEQARTTYPCTSWNAARPTLAARLSSVKAWTQLAHERYNPEYPGSLHHKCGP
eukprot:3267529-Rhodomonas_salina.1